MSPAKSPEWILMDLKDLGPKLEQTNVGKKDRKETEKNIEALKKSLKDLNPSQLATLKKTSEKENWQKELTPQAWELFTQGLNTNLCITANRLQVSKAINNPTPPRQNTEPSERHRLPKLRTNFFPQKPQTQNTPTLPEPKSEFPTTQPETIQAQQRKTLVSTLVHRNESRKSVTPPTSASKQRREPQFPPKVKINYGNSSRPVEGR